MTCPCGSDLEYARCCEPVITDAKTAATAEQLMRARYTAYTQAAMDFLYESQHPDFRDRNDQDSARDWAENSEWNGLAIMETEAGGPDDDSGKVEFLARYTYGGDEAEYHEVGEFVKEGGRWYFTEGTPGVRKPAVREEPKVGRNDPCSCGSGKKFKRCCG
jgi:SEC-C motif-containing protein